MVNTNELKASLKRKGITQEELAKRVNMNPSTLNRKINNAKGENLTVQEAKEIAEVLEIPRSCLTDIFFATQLTDKQVVA